MNRFVVAGFVASLALAPLAMGCGTIMGHAGLQDLKLNITAEDPRIPQDLIKDADVSVNGNPQGQAKGPGVYKVDSRSNGNKVEVRMNVNGLRIQGTGNATREIMPLAVVADAFMLIFPIYIDYADGGMYRLQEEMTVHLGIVGDTSTTTTDFPGGRTNTQNGFYDKNGSNTSQPTNTDTMKPCPFCGEPRPSSAVNCPHCGQH